MTTIRAAARPASRSTSCKRDRREAHHGAEGLPSCTAPSQRFLDNRRKTIETGEGIDWATAEALAFGTLLLEGHPGAPVRPGRASAAPSRSAMRC